MATLTTHRVVNTALSDNSGVTFRDYLELCKIKVITLLVLTAVVGAALAPDMGRGYIAQILSLIGIGLLSSSAAVINHVVDSRIDAIMARTKNRPLVKKRVSRDRALFFSAALAVTGFTLLVVFANWLTAYLTLFALLGYAVVYTSFLKRATPQNIVIGGLAGAMPPLLGWVSETGALQAEPWILVMIIFTWTPPHFWALAIHRRADYAKANIPMLPVTHGVDFTKTCLLLYTVLLALVCILPFLINMSGLLYLGSAMCLNSLFIYKAWQLKFSDNNRKAYALFTFSIVHLTLLFIVFFVDKLFLWTL